MSIADDIARLQEMHESGALTDAEFVAPKARLLAADSPASAPSQDAGLQRDVRRLGIQNQILQLDQDWQAERETLMVRGRYGSRYTPTRSSSLRLAAVVGMASLFLLVFPAFVPFTGSTVPFGVAGTN